MLFARLLAAPKTREEGTTCFSGSWWPSVEVSRAPGLTFLSRQTERRKGIFVRLGSWWRAIEVSGAPGREFTCAQRHQGWSGRRFLRRRWLGDGGGFHAGGDARKVSAARNRLCDRSCEGEDVLAGVFLRNTYEIQRRQRTPHQLPPRLLDHFSTCEPNGRML